MATKLKTFVRVSVYFDNGQAAPFDLDPKLDTYKETPKELIITRGDDSKRVIKIDRRKVSYHIVGRVKELTPEQKSHPAFDPGDDDGINLRG